MRTVDTPCFAAEEQSSSECSAMGEEPTWERTASGLAEPQLW